MGIPDRIIRTLLAITIVILYLTGNVSGVTAVILGIFALVFFATSAIGFCPLYVPFKISTCKKNNFSNSANKDS